MADTNQLLDQMRKVVREETEPLKKDLQDVKREQAAQKTLIEAIAAGQKEIQETMATKADVLSLGVKLDKLRKRVEGIEEDTGSTPRHKN